MFGLSWLPKPIKAHLEWYVAIGLILTMTSLGKAQSIDLPQDSDGTPAQDMTPLDDIVKLETSRQQTRFHLTRPDSAMHQAPLMVNSATAPGSDNLSPEDAQNMTHLWQTIISKNPVIQYSLKQLATPPELRYTHASAMSRTLGGLLAGAGMLPYMFSVDQYAAAAGNMSANMVDRAVMQTQKIDPDKLPSDTELVELSGMVQTLQKQLAENYFDYKGNLMRLTKLDKTLLHLQTQWQNEQAVISSQSLLTLHLLQSGQAQRQQVLGQTQADYLTLERLVGVNGMQQLHFDGLPEVSQLVAPAR